MAKKCGRPKGNIPSDNKEKIIEAALELIKTEGASDLKVRTVCEHANVATGTFYHYFKNKDDLLMHFVRILSFDEIKLNTPADRIAERISEMYMHLVNKYLSMGKEFMKGFYSTENKALSAYMGTDGGAFEKGPVMHSCEKEIDEAIKRGILKAECDAHLLSADICTIVKGIIFEWCLMDNDNQIEDTLNRILNGYLSNLIR